MIAHHLPDSIHEFEVGIRLESLVAFHTIEEYDIYGKIKVEFSIFNNLIS